MALKTWDDVKPRILKSRKHLLLGNGFNLALLDAEGLSYSRLKESINDAKFIITGKMKDALSQEGNNFETLIRKLEEASIVSGYYGATSENMKQDAKALREELARCVSDLHPLQDRIIENGASKNCAEFLKQFGNIFTLNYDLLLYWVIIKEKMESVFSDGFGRPSYPDPGPLVWMKKDRQNVFYAHGALHLFEKKYKDITDEFVNNSSHYVEKLENSRENIITQVKDCILRGDNPMTVVEGSQEQKFERIILNDYLRNCLLKLRSLKGSVYTYGWSASIPEDTHLINALGASEVKNCYFGVRSEDGCQKIIEAFDKVNGERSRNNKDQLSLIFYDVSTAPMWR